MKKYPLLILLIFPAMAGFAQKQLLSYDDLKFLLHNNLRQADTFMMAKGYAITVQNIMTNNRNYDADLPGGTHTSVNIRLDGKRLFIEIETNVLEQYDLIHNSIAQYVRKDAQVGDVQTYSVKELGEIYIAINDAMPFDALKKNYDIHIVADKNLTVYN